MEEPFDEVYFIIILFILFILFQGWLPQKLVETSLAGVMVDTVRDIRQHASTLHPA